MNISIGVVRPRPTVAASTSWATSGSRAAVVERPAERQLVEGRADVNFLISNVEYLYCTHV